MNESINRLFYSGKELSDFTGLSRTAISQAIRNGRIAATRVGSRILIPASEVERLKNEAFETQANARAAIAEVRS